MMKYSIRGRLSMTDGTSLVGILNTYNLWKLETGTHVNETGEEIFSFEVWLNTTEEKDSLFDKLKPFVDEFGETIDWHECTHDEENSKPCKIIQTYRGS